ncbi:MAG: hypothetical protein IH948_00110 [Bacteroidetes bacterium]|nr:hypothetical protein [Bacteroidota bacterium]
MAKEISERILDKKSLKDGLYRIEFITELDQSKSGNINLTVKMTRDLNALISSLSTDEMTYTNFSYIKRFRRYKHKSFLSGSLSGYARQLLFHKDLVDTGIAIFIIENVQAVENVIENMKSACSTLLKTLLQLNQKRELQFEVK